MLMDMGPCVVLYKVKSFREQRENTFSRLFESVFPLVDMPPQTICQIHVDNFSISGIESFLNLKTLVVSLFSSNMLSSVYKTSCCEITSLLD